MTRILYFQKIGESWVTDLYNLRELKQFDSDENFLRTLIKVKQVSSTHLNILKC